jgi:hypothetical protein
VPPGGWSERPVTANIGGPTDVVNLGEPVYTRCNTSVHHANLFSTEKSDANGLNRRARPPGPAGECASSSTRTAALTSAPGRTVRIPGAARARARIPLGSRAGPVFQVADRTSLAARTRTRARRMHWPVARPMRSSPSSSLDTIASESGMRSDTRTPGPQGGPGHRSDRTLTRGVNRCAAPVRIPPADSDPRRKPARTPGRILVLLLTPSQRGAPRRAARPARPAGLERARSSARPPPPRSAPPAPFRRRRPRSLCRPSSRPPAPAALPAARGTAKRKG